MTTENETTTATTKPPRTRRPKATTGSASLAFQPVPPISKSDTVIKLLLRAKGATPLELIAATDWQAHSVRAFLSGLRKKGRAIVREARKNGEFAYRIVVAPAPAEEEASKEPSDAADGTPSDTAVA